MNTLKVLIEADGVVRKFTGEGDGAVVVAAFRAWLAGPDGHLPMAEGVDELEREASEIELGESGGGTLTAEQSALVESHLEWAKSGAWKFCRRGRGRYEFDDFFSAAVMGLIIAARRFDPARGFTFKTYAMNWTEQQMRRVYQTDRRQNGWRWNSKAPGSQELVAPRAEWPMDDDGNRVDLPDPGANNIESVVYRRQLRALLLRCAKNQRHRRVMLLRLKGLTHEQIASRLGVTRQWVHQIEQTFIERAKRNQALRLVAAS